MRMMLAVMAVAFFGILAAGGDAAPTAATPADIRLMGRAVTIELLGKAFVPTDTINGVDMGYITLRFSIVNNTKLDLKAVFGNVQFNDLKGNAVDSEEFDDDDVIKAHRKVIYSARMQYNPYDNNNVAFSHMQASELKAVFYPHGMLFTNGPQVGTMWHSLYCHQKFNLGIGPCDFAAQGARAARPNRL
jgi:hypothetical protein